MKPEAILLTLTYTLVTPQLIRTIHYTYGSVCMLRIMTFQTLHFVPLNSHKMKSRVVHGYCEFYHASDVKGREKVERSYWMWEDNPQRTKTSLHVDITTQRIQPGRSSIYNNTVTKGSELRWTHQQRINGQHIFVLAYTTTCAH